MFGWFSKKHSVTPSLSDINGIMIKLFIDANETLFILVESDGSINRMGSLTGIDSKPDLYIGHADQLVFMELRNQISAELLGWCGQAMNDTELQGKVCELTVGFKMKNGQVIATAWRFGTDSAGPPPEVRQFIQAAITATNPWYQQQQMTAKNSELNNT